MWTWKKYLGILTNAAEVLAVPIGEPVTPEEYLERAERYRIALETTKDSYTRYHLECMERSYRTLAVSERALRMSPGPFASDKLTDGGER